MIGVWALAPGRWEAQQRGLHERVVPAVRQAPGFAAGYWTADRPSGKTYSVIIMESEEAARGLVAFVEGNAADAESNGVGRVSLTVTEVLAEALR